LIATVSDGLINSIDMDNVAIFQQDSNSLIRIFLVGSLAYVGLLIFLRISGQRTLAQLNAYDFVITIALGSTLGRLITAEGVSLEESLMAFFTLIALQFLVSWLSIHSSAFENLVTAKPSLLYLRGEFLQKTMRKKRLTKAQLLANVRENRIGSLQDVEAIVLESTGKIAVIRKATTGEENDLSALQNFPQLNLEQH
jgi:uncharacterized membrane protein YcaP (DUF421 family)